MDPANYPWIMEGSGMYFESGDWDGSGNLVVTEPVPWYHDYFLEHLSANRLINLNTLLHMSRSTFYNADQTKTYSQSMMLFFFLMKRHPGTMDALFDRLNNETITTNDGVLSFLLSSLSMSMSDLEDAYIDYAVNPDDPPDINQPPTAVVSAAPLSGDVPLDVTFDGSASFDTDGTVVGFQWDFGDGSPVTTGATVTHTYNYDATFVATLTVWDEDGATALNHATIVVSLPEPEPEPTAPAAPTNLAASISASTVTLGWSRPGSDLEYTLERGLKVKRRPTAFEVIATGLTSKSHVDTVPADGTYQYRVMATDPATGLTAEYSNTAQAQKRRQRGGGKK